MEFLESTAVGHTPRSVARVIPIGQKTLVLAALLLAVVVVGCSDSAKVPTSTANAPQLYMAPVVFGISGGVTSTDVTYSISDQDMTFAQKTYGFSDTQSGARLSYSGNLTALSRGLLEMELTYECGSTSIAGCSGITYSPPQAGSGWAVELAGQSGGLLQLTGQSFVPLVPAAACPSMSSAETFLFVTVPSELITSGTPSGATSKGVWNPQIETAYGSVDIGASGSTVTLNNIKQYVLPSAGGGTPANAPASSIAGACSSTVYGANTVAVPPDVTITTSQGTTTYAPQAMMGIGPSGLLVEDNGTANASSAPYYENALGAGTGAIGLPKPSSAIETSALVSAQYLGFFYGTGNQSSSNPNSSSSVASFGFSSLPSTCAAVAANTSTMLYGGHFTGNNPAAAAAQRLRRQPPPSLRPRALIRRRRL